MKKSDNSKLVEEELHQTQLLLKASLESPKDIIILSINKNYEYLFFNNAHKDVMKSVYGVDVEIGMNLIDCITIDDDKGKAIINFDIALSGESHSMIDEYGDKDRSYFETFYNPILDENKNIIGATAFARDITERKIAEKKLEDINLRHSAMIANIGDVIGIISVDGTVKYTSLNVEKWFGWKPEDLLGSDGWRTVHPEDLKSMQGKFDNLLKKDNSQVTTEYRFKCKDNSYTWIELTAVNCIKNPSINGILLNYHDITERKKTEEALRLSEVQYKSLFQNLDSSFSLYEVVVDKDGNPYDYKILAVNPMYEKTVGVTADSVVGKTILEAFPQTESAWIETMNSTVTSGIPFSIENFAMEVNKWIEITVYVPEKGQLAMIATDVTERKQVEVDLAAEKERLAVTLRSIGDGVITTDSEHNITMLNKAAEEMTGWHSEDAIGRPLLEVFNIINELTEEQYENPAKMVIETGTIVELSNQTCLVSKNGKKTNIADSGAPIRDSKSNIIGVVLVFRDISEKQRLEASNQRAQKLESLGVLAGGIAHDFNNLLGGIYGFIDLANETTNEKNVQIYLTKALATIDRARSLTQQLLTFAKGGAPIKEIEDLFPFVEETVTFALSGSTVSSNFKIEDNLWSCNFDKNQIGQVIDNLTINALQAMPNGGTIHISATNTTLKENDHISLSPGDYVCISIQDQGIGIPKDFLPRIFDPFYTTKPKGHGLGLATCYSIINRHGGCIDVESNPGKGSTFNLYLPASINASSNPQKNIRDEHKGSGTFLVMDDEEIMLDLIGSMLQSLNYSVILKKNGKDAVDFFKSDYNDKQEIKGMIFDLTIPGGMSGKEAIKEIRKLNPDIPVFVASGYAQDPIMANPKKHGFTASICKPFRISDLVTLLKNNMNI